MTIEHPTYPPLPRSADCKGCQADDVWTHLTPTDRRGMLRNGFVYPQPHACETERTQP